MRHINTGPIGLFLTALHTAIDLLKFLVTAVHEKRGKIESEERKSLESTR